MRKLFLLFISIIGVALSASAQGRSVSGVVVSGDDNEPIVGATVMVTGTTLGTTTDIDGKFQLSNVPASAKTLRVSYVGMTSQEVPITKGEIRIVLGLSSELLDEVVVTALGISRSEKTLGYAATQVNSEDIVAAQNTNVMQSLSGKVAGLQIQTTSSAPGSGTNVVVRGLGSVMGSNQPLYVIDGVPTASGDVNTGGNRLAANGLANLSPDDIASVTVLKGAAATALYGSRAANGVIMVTTKTGKAGRQKNYTVTYSGNVAATMLADLPKWQNSYGQGWDGGQTFIENGSWGPKLDGSMQVYGPIYNYSQLIHEYSAKKNNVKDFFDTGFSQTHNVALSGVSDNEKMTYYMSYSYTGTDGIMPDDHDTYTRNSFSFRGSYQPENWFKLSSAVNFATFQTKAVSQDGPSTTLMSNVNQFARDISLVDMKDLKNVFNTPDAYFTPYGVTNPYWTLENNYNLTKGKQVFGRIQADIKPYDKLTLTYRFGFDYSDLELKDGSAEIHPDWSLINSDIMNSNGIDYGGYVSNSMDNTGYVYNYFYRRHELNHDFMANWGDVFLNEKLDIRATVGLSLNERGNSYMEGERKNLAVYTGFWALGNGANFDTLRDYQSKRRSVGLYGDISIGWDEWLFLDVTARNDWSSTLPKENRSFFYPGVTLAAIFTKWIPENDILSFGKVRLAYGKTGNDASPYYVKTTFSSSPSYVNGWTYLNFPIGGVNAFSLANTAGNNNLRPEMNTEFETGLNLRFFDSRLEIDAAYYNRITDGQILPLRIEDATGHTYQYVNFGKVRNRGVELMVNVTPVRTSKVRWDIGLNWALNRNKVLSLPGESGDTKVNLAGIGWGGKRSIQQYAEAGKPIGTIWSYIPQYVKDENSPHYGKMIVDNNGMPVLSDELEYTGYDTNAKWTGGVNTSISAFGLTLSGQMDMSIGGHRYMAQCEGATFAGNGYNTIYNDRQPTVLPNTVVSDGHGGYVENTTPIYSTQGGSSTWQSYYTYSTNGAGGYQYLINRSYAKLRNVSLTWDLPEKWVRACKLDKISLTVYGNNLLTITHKRNWFGDPEVTTGGNYDSSLGFGGTAAANPTYREVGMNLRVTF